MQLQREIEVQPSTAHAAAGESQVATGAMVRGSLRHDSMERLEDSLIGNDVLLEESRGQSGQLQARLRPCLRVDRHDAHHFSALAPAVC